MKITIVTAFPNSFAPLQESIVKRAQDKGKLELEIVDLRKFTKDKRQTIDDKIFGGGAGMLLQVEPIYYALKSFGISSPRERTKGEGQLDLTSQILRSRNKSGMTSKYQTTNVEPQTKVVLTSARGSKWTQQKALEYSKNLDHLIIICGHYEGVDNRVAEHLIDEEISIGNYILSGGELASMVITDSIVRLIDGVVGNTESIEDETEFTEDGIVPEYPQYTRPETFVTDEGEEWKVPEVLLSGNHAEIEKWKLEQKKLSK